MANLQAIEQIMALLESQRATLGDAAVETSLAALRRQLAELEQQEVKSLALRGERKQVTVMFADISGFTAMSEKLDPEEVRSLINACFERLGAVIDHYEGHIDKFIGDEIMALFGAPVAHENDPERALRAALDMMTALDEFNQEHAAQIPKPLALHFGINSGLVIAGGIGTSQRQDYSVMGDTVNLAARLEGLSEAGEILVGEDTYRLTVPLFEFETLKPVKVKGKQKPVQVYRLLRAKKLMHGQLRGVAGLSAPLVGREAEMALLTETLHNLLAGKGGLVSVIGEAGIGKSRLIQELYHLCQEHLQAGQVNWVEGRALSHGENASYLVTRDVLCNLLGIDLEAPPPEVGQRLQTEVNNLFPGQSTTVYPYLAYLLEVPLAEAVARRLKYLEGEALHQRIFNATHTYLSTKAKQQPLILVWEDLHWADPSSLALLETLLPLTQHCPLLLLLVYRPLSERRIWDFHQRASQRANKDHNCIELAPLSYDESYQLLDHLMGHCDMTEKTRHSILNKAEGNPFFIEEVIRSMIDSGLIIRSEDDQRWIVTKGIEDLEIPDTLQGVIMARIDRLDLATKRILQVASVIGRNFSYRVLDQVLGKQG